MIDVFNRVLSNVKFALTDICPDVTATSRDSPANFPCVEITQIDNPDAAEDLENFENAVEPVIELQAYSNKSLTEARKVISIACDAMRQMGFRRRMGPQQVQNAAVANVFRMVARFERLVWSGEEIEKFEAGGE